MARGLWSAYERLDKLDIRVLHAIESGLSKYEYVPAEVIERRLRRVPPTRVLRSLDKLNELKLIRRMIGYTVGYTLTYMGLDVVALDSLVRRGVIAVLGERIGAGKEGAIYLAETPEGRLVVVKFHREGRRSFQHIRRHRPYAADLPRKSWFRMAKLIGEREFKIMVALVEEGARVPEPIAWSRHAVVQEYVPGVELYRIRGLGEDEAHRILEGIVGTLQIAYQRVGIVHGDLSEYNVLVTEDLEPYIIDWPQYVYRDDPQAEELLRRDVEYIVAFFRRRFRIQASTEEILARVRGG